MREIPNPTVAFSSLLPSLDIRRSLHRAPEADVHNLSAKGSARALDNGRIEVSWAKHLDEVRAAQRLRYQVFAGEMGASVQSPVAGHDIDLFDDYCEHLLVRMAGTTEVIGTYRLLTPAQAKRVGCTYTDTEFDITRLRNLRERMVELGRSCVHADHRQGGVILALWGALAEFMHRNRLDVMVGCASIPMLRDGMVCTRAATAIWDQLRQTHLAGIEHRATPRVALPLVEEQAPASHVEPPALIKGYLRLGARVMGPPAWDPEFNTADLPMIMHLADLPARYRKHFGV